MGSMMAAALSRRCGTQPDSFYGPTRDGRLWLEGRPLPFGNHLDGAVDDLDGRLFVDGVGRDADLGRPPLGVSQAVRRECVQVREDREVDDSQGTVVRRSGPLDE